MLGSATSIQAVGETRGPGMPTAKRTQFARVGGASIADAGGHGQCRTKRDSLCEQHNRLAAVMEYKS